MMKLRIEELLDYLKAGADDPQIERRLEMDPDGTEMLRQAKLLFDLLGRLPAAGEDDESAEAIGIAAAEAAVDYSKADEFTEPDMFDESESDQIEPLSAKKIDSLTRLTQRAAGTVSDLGQLHFEFAGNKVSLSFMQDLRSLDWSTSEEIRASRKSYRFFDPAITNLFSGSKPDGTLEVHGNGLTISAPENISNRDVVSLEIRDSRLDKPARALELIFMPETGPFTRFVTNSKGVAEMPVPERPGVLRIESKSPQLIQILVKK
jgi:hypothetical protein